MPKLNPLIEKAAEAEIARRLRRAACFQCELHQKRSCGRSNSVPWYVQVMFDAADELEEYRGVFNEEALLRLTGRYYGIAPARLRELAEADKDHRLLVLPCKVGEYWRDDDGRRLRVTGFDSFEGLSILYRYEGEETEYCRCPVSFEGNFTREEN